MTDEILKSDITIVTGVMGHIGSRFMRESKALSESSSYFIDSFQTDRYSSVFNFKKSFKLFEVKLQEFNIDTLSAEEKYRINNIVHFAATTDATGTYDNPSLIWDNNKTATEAAIELALETGALLVFPSSTSVYGSQRKLVDENTLDLNPQSPYAECKLAEEEMIKSAIRNFGLRAVILRLGTIAGISPGMRFHTAVNKFCWQASFNQPITVWRTALHQKRPYLSITDAIAAIDFVIGQNLKNGDILNVLSGNYSVDEIVKIIEMTLGKRLQLDFVDTPIMNQYSYEVSRSKLEQMGFNFHDSIKTDIRQTLELLKRENK